MAITIPCRLVCTVVARSGLEEALARERIYDELERQAEQQGMTLEEWLAMQKHRNQYKDQHQDLHMDRNRHQEAAAETWLQKSKEERIRIAFEQMKTEKCQGRTANYFGRRVGYQYAFILALMRAKDERYGLPYVETTNEFLTYLKEYVGVKDLPSEDTIGKAALPAFRVDTPTGESRMATRWISWRRSMWRRDSFLSI